MYLLSSQSGFDLLTLIEILQTNLPESCQVLLKTHTMYEREENTLTYSTCMHTLKTHTNMLSILFTFKISTFATFTNNNDFMQYIQSKNKINKVKLGCLFQMQHTLGSNSSYWTQREFCADKLDVLWERWIVKMGIQGCGSYLLLFVDFWSPTSSRTSPAPIDCSHVLSGALLSFNLTTL